MANNYCIFLVILFLLVSFVARATVVRDLYGAESPVNRQTAHVRNPAIKKAFASVLIKVSGNLQATKNPILKRALANSSDYVQQYSYQTNIGPQAQSQPYILSVKFEPAAVNKLLLKAGLSVWGQDRPLSLVWIASDIGGSRKLISASDSGPIVNLFEKYADARGIPVIFPVLDLTDLNQLSFDDVMAPFVSVITQASIRYGSNAVVIVRIKQTEQQLHSFWTLVANGRLLNWKVNGDNLNFIMKKGIDDITEGLASQFALSSSVGQSKVNLQIKGIDNIAGFAKIKKYLKHLLPVKSVEVLEVQPTQVTFQLGIVGNIMALQRAIRLDHILKAAKTMAEVSTEDVDNSPSIEQPQPTIVTLVYTA